MSKTETTKATVPAPVDQSAIPASIVEADKAAKVRHNKIKSTRQDKGKEFFHDTYENDVIKSYQASLNRLADLDADSSKATKHIESVLTAGAGRYDTTK